MKNILFFTDIHINPKELEECSLVLDEILALTKQYNITEVYDLGDSFDTLKPTPLELDLFSSFIKKLEIPITIIAAKSHESSTPEDTILTHFGILNNQIRILTEFKDENKLYVGHFIVKESKKGFDATISKNELKNFRWVILGHQHSQEIIKPNIMQLSSCRYINFDEVNDKQKVVFVIEDYDSSQPKYNTIALKSCYPMVLLNLGEKLEKNAILDPQNAPLEQKSTKSQAQNPLNSTAEWSDVKSLCSYLDSLAPKTKVKIVFNNYALWREFLPFYKTYENKFYVWREDKNFLTSLTAIAEKKENVDLKNSLIIWMKKNQVEEKIQKILLEEFK